MGVKDLWQLLSPVGRRVSIETLEGKTLAIDMSIWLTQFIKAMRDEEGKMLKNAHILGTLRRILKLLHHRIRPVFVFDGATPALKLRVVQNRRKNHERQESNRRAAVHKLILAQLKKQLLSSSSIAAASTPQQVMLKSPSSNFAPGFVVPSSSSLSVSAATPIAIVDVQEEEKEEPGFEWTDGSDLPKPKSLIDNEEDDGSEEEEQIFDLPEDNQLDVDALSSLPAHIRKRIIEDARRRERMRSRATYIPVADNPALYSQTQLANFLSTSKLNRRFDEAQKRIDGSAKTGIKIASEGSKKYLYVSRGELLPARTRTDQNDWLASDTDTDIDQDDENDEDRQEESDMEFTDQDWMNTVSSPYSSSKRTLNSNQGKKRRRLLKKQPPVVNEEVIDVTGEGKETREEDNDGHFSPQYNYPDSPPVETTATKAEDAVENVQQDNVEAAVVVDITQQTAESDDTDPLADIEWEAEEVQVEAEAEEEEEVMIVDNVERVDRDYYMSDDDEDLAWMKEDDELNQAEGAVDLISPPTSLLSAPPSDTISKKQAAEALQHAVATASGMGDWAGRAVRRVMKEHFHTNVTSSTTTTTTLATGVVASSSSVAAVSKSEEVTKAVDEAITAMDLTIDEDDVKPKGQQSYHLRAILSPSTAVQQPVSSVDLIKSTEQRTAHVHFEPHSQEQAEQEIDIEATKKSLHAAARDSERVTEEMKHDVIQLIQSFNLPFIIAPFEAEAQCAVLEELGLVDGVITEDSDAFLFGAQSVYKNIFNDRKFVEVYLAEDAKRELGIAREDFIALAFFLGSDYTEGVNGIGIVNAMEIVQAFPMRSESGGPLEGLQRFKQWLDGYDFAKDILDELHLRKTTSKKTATQENEEEDEEEALLQELTDPEQRLVRFDSKHRTGRAKWTLPGNFPDAKVAQAYFRPETNHSDKPFAWTQPIRSKARAYCKEILGWSDSQLDLQLDPVLQRYAERSTQTRIDSHYTTYHDNARFAKIASERLRSAVVQITGKKTNLALGMTKKTKGNSKKLKPASTSPADEKEKQRKERQPPKKKRKRNDSEDEGEEDNAGELNDDNEK